MLHLNCHSVYSYKNSIAYVENIAKRSSEMGESSFCITDINSLTACIKGCLFAQKLKMKLIQGLDALIFPDESISEGHIDERIRFVKKEMGLKRTTEAMFADYQRELKKLESVDSVPYHAITLIAKNLDGLKNLFSIYNCQEMKFDEWMSDKGSISKFAGSLICLVGGYNSDVQYLLNHGKIDEAEQCLDWYVETFGENLFGKVEFDTKLEMVQLFEKKGIPLVLSNDCRYVESGDSLDYRLFSNIFAGKPVERFRNNGHMMDDGEFYSLMEDDGVKERFQLALDNVKVVEGLCDPFSFPKAKSLIDCREQLQDLCDKGWEKLRKGTDREDESLKRYAYELEVINGKGFSQYFIKVLNIILVAKELGIMCGPGRGSGAGSEILYLLGITHIDPLYYNLYFERFLNPGRPGYPDIDLDFSSVANP